MISIDLMISIGLYRSLSVSIDLYRSAPSSLRPPTSLVDFDGL